MRAIIKRLLLACQCAVLLVIAPSCAWKAPSPSPLAVSIRQANTALDGLPGTLSSYNAAVLEVCRDLESRGTLVQQDLRRLDVDFQVPRSELKISRIEVVHVLPTNNRASLGVPVVIRYDAPAQSYYPPEGLFVNATAVYEKTRGAGRIVIRAGADKIHLGDRDYPAATDTGAAGDSLNRLAGELGSSGFMNMIRPQGSSRKPRIYLLDPYDPDKIPLLMVHGLQSTPLAFHELVKSLRQAPAFRRKYQIWQFHYASGTPVLVNAASLRSSLNETISALDPQGRSRACRDIVVVGHSMGGVISHTLVSSSGEKVWSSVFKVPPSKLKGDPEAVAYLDRILHFKKDPRISKVIFMAAPHRGSPVSLSLIGFTGNLVTRLSTMEEQRFTELALANRDAMTEEAAAFYGGGRFSAVRTLSPRSPALLAVSALPIGVPFHNIIGQKHNGSVQDGSDGVVPYWSSRLQGARSEKIVRSGHGVISNPDAILEVKRILLNH